MITALLRRVPWPAWVGVGVALALWWGVVAWGDARYAAGRRSVTTTVSDGARGAIDAATGVASARVDTIRERVVVTRWKVQAAVAALPPEVAALPPVQVLVSETTTLTRQVDSLVTALDQERAMRVLRAAVDSAEIVGLRVTVADQQHELARRPQWRHVLGGVAVGVALGVVGMVAR